MAKKKTTTKTPPTKKLSLVKQLESQGVRNLGQNAGVKAPAYPVTSVVDWVSGVGGLPWNRLLILRGTEGGGKTTILLHAAASVQADGGSVLFLDMEHKFDPHYATTLGVDLNSLMIAQPPHMEACFTLIHKAIEAATDSNARLLIVLDSMNATITKAEFEGTWEDEHWSPQAKRAAPLLAKLTHYMSNLDSDNRVSVVMISQLRKGQRATKTSSTAWGNAPRFYATQVLSLRKEGNYEVDGVWAGSELVLEAVKNQVAVPFRSIVFRIPADGKIHAGESLLRAGLAAGVIDQAGSWYSFDSRRLGQGLDKAAAFLGDNALLYEEVLQALRDSDEVPATS